jgi:hypothetical protein
MISISIKQEDRQMEKEIFIGHIPGSVFGYKRGQCKAYFTYELKDTEKGLVFSMSGHVKSTNGRSWLMGGQCVDEIAKHFQSNKKTQRMAQIWERWHLNDMRAGCEHQRAEDWGKERVSETGKLSCWVYPNEHPKGVLMKPCPVCGYKFGSAWLIEELPSDIVTEIRSW